MGQDLGQDFPPVCRRPTKYSLWDGDGLSKISVRLTNSPPKAAWAGSRLTAERHGGRSHSKEQPCGRIGANLAFRYADHVAVIAAAAR